MPLAPAYPVETRRLRLRPLQLGDVDALLEYHSSPEVHRFLPMGTMDEATIRARLTDGAWSRSTIEVAGDALVLGVELAATGELVGEVMLLWVLGANRCGEVGYVFHPAHAGRGYATESVVAVLGLAFEDLGLHRVIARVDAKNAPSLALAERLGMRREAYLRESWWRNGEWEDEVHFGLLASEWRATAEEPGSATGK
jgi:RimJ/RimL family protein N-acetyltransferase